MLDWLAGQFLSFALQHYIPLILYWNSGLYTSGHYAACLAMCLVFWRNIQGYSVLKNSHKDFGKKAAVLAEIALSLRSSQ